ncbi:MAG TPA: DUF4010 domain-containing protein [Vicinamibacterales bacterium]|nr:DUF4010 domain-containing protein [Vicinamibacterales bacterium]
MNASTLASPQGWPFFPTLVRLAIAVAVGVFVGLEREHSRKTGVRTFALMSLLGCLAGLAGEVYAWIVLPFAGLVTVLMNWREMARHQQMALTTSVALMLVTFCGFLTGRGHNFTPAVVAIVTAALLAWKQPISGFVSGLTDKELRSAILLAILTVIVLPVLPVEPVDPWRLVAPRENWASVVLIAAIGFVNYILLRVLGPRGMEITAFFGGLVNSRKVVVELAGRLRDNAVLLPVVYRGILLTTVAMALRNALIVAVFVPIAAAYCALPLGAMMAVSGLLWLRQPSSPAIDGHVALTLESPFSLSAALKFGLVFLLLNVVGALAERHFGSSSFYFVSMAGGLLSSGSSIAAAASLIRQHELSMQTGINGVVLSSLTSLLVNIPLVRKLIDDASIKQAITRSILMAAVAGAIGLLVNDWVWPLFSG